MSHTQITAQLVRPSGVVDVKGKWLTEGARFPSYETNVAMRGGNRFDIRINVEKPVDAHADLYIVTGNDNTNWDREQQWEKFHMFKLSRLDAPGHIHSTVSIKTAKYPKGLMTPKLKNAIFGVKLEIRRTDNTDVKIADLDLVYPYIMFQWRIRTVDSETGASPTMRECNNDNESARRYKELELRSLPELRAIRSERKEEAERMSLSLDIIKYEAQIVTAQREFHSMAKR